MMSVIDIIGNTPLIRLDKINPNPKVVLYGKFEGANPGGSIKDRTAFYMIKDAYENGNKCALEKCVVYEKDEK